MAARDPVFRHEVRHDLHFQEAIAFGNYISVRLVKSESLHPAWLTFQNSIESVLVMAALPHSIVTTSVEYLVPLAQAILNVSGKIVLDDDENDRYMSDIAPEFERIGRTLFSGKPRSYRAFRAGLFQRANRHLSESMLTRGGLFVLMEAQIIGVWTAFSTLTTELAIAAINERPTCLHGYKKQKLELSSLLDAGDDQNWNGRMGELAKLFVRFDSFSKTVEAYERLFPAQEVQEIMRRPMLGAACLVRNQCVHDSSTATPNFVREAKKFGIEPWQSAAIGELLPINGKDAATLCEGVVQGANDLILALDKWLLPRSKRADTPQRRA